jgi:GMP synthase-like glutamine amidotransferase
MSILRFHIIQHVAFEGPGYIAEWIEKQRYKLSYTHLYNNEALPLHTSYDVLIVMGGPMGVYDHDKYPWLILEKKFLSEAISLNKKILGICLGSQLLASVLGARVYANSEKEIGFLPVTRVSDQNAFFCHFPDATIVFHWHGDTFDLPPHAILLASSEACVNQAFVVNNTILGLQFHLEVTSESVHDLLHHGKHELIEKPYIQKESDIVDKLKYLPSCHMLLESILEQFVES